MNERDVFIAALQIEPGTARRDYLDRACAGDEALRRGVEALLAAHERAGAFLQEPAFAKDAAQTGPFTDPSPETLGGPAEPARPTMGPFAPPQQPDELGRLGHYRVLRLLGQGGMGMVYLADDTRLTRQVALKVLRPELAASPDARQRFLREARAAATIEHDHIVAIYAVDEDRGVPYLAMPLLKGMSLEDYLKRGKPLTLGQALRIGRETARGLQAAHERGLMHRDVKPANLWLDATAGGRVKLLDFGLARSQQGDTQITGSDMILGTPAYMAPEQVAGKAEARSDLYSLGVVLYRLLSGQLPFPQADTLALMVAVATDPPPPLQAPGAPPALVKLVMRLLAKKPADRPASAKAVWEELRAIERDLAAPAADAGPSAERPRPDAPAQRRLVLAVALVLAWLVVGLTVVFWGRRQGAETPAPVVPVPPKLPPVEPVVDGGGGGKKEEVKPRPKSLPVRPFSLPGHGSQVDALAFTADGKTLVSTEYWGKVLYWDMERREKPAPKVVAVGGHPEALAIDRQGRWLAVARMSPNILLFPFGTSVAAGTLKGHTQRVTQLAFLKDGKTLLSTGHDGSIRRWDVEKQKEGKPLLPPGRRIDCLAVWEDGRGGLRLAYAGPNFVGVDGQELERLSSQPLGVALSPDGTRLACPARDEREGGVALWELPGKVRLGQIPGSPRPRGLAFTPDGKHVVVAGGQDTRIYETADGKQAARVEHPENAAALAVSPDGRWLAVGTLKGLIRVWHLPTLLAPPG
jgi:hypothetical protein